MVHQLVYASNASLAFGPAELHQLLHDARATNSALRLTGLLLFNNGQFLQVLEGEPAAVHALYASICRDVRHADVQLLADGPMPARAFPDWAMGFLPVPDADFSRFTGYVNPGSPTFLLARAQNIEPELLTLIRDFMAGQEVDY